MSVQDIEQIPSPAEFRAWLQDSLAILNRGAVSVGQATGLGKNTLGDFLRDSSRSIHMDTARKVQAYLRVQASLSGVLLPRLGTYRAKVNAGNADGC